MRVESVMIHAVRQLLKRPRLADTIFRFDSWGNTFNEANTRGSLSHVARSAIGTACGLQADVSTVVCDRL